MANPSNSAVQNLLPVQAYFDAQNNFITFIGQGQPFTATINPDQSGLNITNSTINSTTIGLTTPAAAAFTNIATNTGTIATQPTGATDIVNLLALQSYAAGISWKQPCAVATLANITLSGLQTIDTYTTLAGDRVLVKDQGTASENGIYIASSGAWSRAIDADVWSDLVCAISFIEYGTQKGGAWFCTAQPGGTINVTANNWAQFTTSATYTAGTGLTLTGSQFSITNTGVPASTYGSATATPVFAVNAQGQITSVTNTTITPAIGNVTGLGTGVATFLATPTSANLAAAVSDETGTGALVFAQSPTLITPALGTPASGILTNCTGLPLSTGVTGTLGITNGGTGQTTASAAFNALSPITTVGDLIYGSATNTSSRLAIGTSGQILSVVAGIPAWVAAPAAMVYPGAGIPNSTGSAWGTSYSTSGSGTVVALTTSPSFTTPILGVPQSGDFSTGTFTWPTFNQNTTGTAAGLSATLAVTSGGTGVTTLTGLAYGNGTSAFTAATGTQIATAIGSTFVTNATNATNATSATSATNATNATNIAITDDTTTNATVYPVWVTTTTGNLPAKTASTKFSFNPSTGVLSATSFSGAGTGLTGTASSLTAGTATTANSVANALTIGTGLKLSSGTTYNGSSALTLNAVGTTINSQTSGYTLVAGDAGKTISITTGGVTINNSVNSAGDIVSIYNNSGSSQTITQGSGVTLQWAGQASSTTGNRTLGLYGLATIVFISSSNAVITGSGLT